VLPKIIVMFFLYSNMLSLTTSFSMLCAACLALASAKILLLNSLQSNIFRDYLLVEQRLQHLGISQNIINLL
jgi:hypothetical protein